MTDSCMPVRMFYCAGMCHEIATVDASGNPVTGTLASDDPATADPNTSESDGEDNESESE